MWLIIYTRWKKIHVSKRGPCRAIRHSDHMDILLITVLQFYRIKITIKTFARKMGHSPPSKTDVNIPSSKDPWYIVPLMLCEGGSLSSVIISDLSSPMTHGEHIYNWSRHPQNRYCFLWVETARSEINHGAWNEPHSMQKEQYYM